MPNNSNESRRKRFRPSFVCKTCRRKKIRCDKQLPCNNCIKSGTESLCEYNSPDISHLWTMSDKGNDLSSLNTTASTISSTDINNSLYTDTETSYSVPLNKTASTSSSQFMNVFLSQPKNEDITNLNPESNLNLNTNTKLAENLEGAQKAKLKSNFIATTKKTANTTAKCELSNEMEELKRQVKRLETLVSNQNSLKTGKQSDISLKVILEDSENGGTKNYPKYRSFSLFNMKIPNLKKPILLSKNNRIQYCGPLSLQGILEDNNRYLKFQSSMKNIIELNKSAWQKSHSDTSTFDPLKMINGEYKQEEIDRLINTYFLPYCGGFEERIEYFEKELHSILFFNFLPMTEILASFKKLFPKDNFTNKYSFFKPDDVIEYSNISLMASLMRLVNVFTEFTEKYNFVNEFEDIHGSLNILALKTLSFANFRDNNSIVSLSALITVRTTLFVLGIPIEDLRADEGSYPFFKLSLQMCYKMGIHISSLPFKSSQLMIDKIWNYIQFIDGIYSIHLGSPLLINYDFCNPRLINEWEPLILNLRLISKEFVSVKPISVNEIVDFMDKLISFISNFPSYSDIISDESQTPYQSSVTFLAKSVFLEIYQRLCLKLRYSLDDLNNFPRELVDEEILKSFDIINKKCEVQLIVCLVLTLNLMKVICNGHTVFNSEAVKSMIFLRNMFNKFIRNSSRTVISYLVFQDVSEWSFKDSKNNEDSETGSDDEYLARNVTVKDLSIDQIESVLSTKLDDINPNSLNLRPFKRLLTDFGEIVNYLTDFYNSVADKPALTETFLFFVQFKFLLTLCVMLDTMNEYKNLSSNGKITSGDWKAILNETKSRLEINTSVDSLDKQVNLNSPWNFEKMFWGEHGEGEDLMNLFGIEMDYGITNSTIMDDINHNNISAANMNIDTQMKDEVNNAFGITATNTANTRDGHEIDGKVGNENKNDTQFYQTFF